MNIQPVTTRNKEATRKAVTFNEKNFCDKTGI